MARSSKECGDGMFPFEGNCLIGKLECENPFIIPSKISDQIPPYPILLDGKQAQMVYSHELIKVWAHSIPPTLHAAVWNLSLFSFLWSCWLFRNEIVFNGIKWDSVQLFDLCILRLAWWCKGNWPVSSITVNDLASCPLSFKFLNCSSAKQSKIAWKPPSKGEVKFNTDGAVIGSFGEAGIGGCMRNDWSRCLVIFSKSVGVVDSTTAEILAIKEAISIFRISRWATKYKLQIETDSKLVEWFTNLHSIPSVFKQLILSCLELCKDLEWQISHIPRECNSCVDSLAKRGIHRLVDYCEVWQDP
ncbi:hypothetical protein GQ457_01G025620 [Hibiscus cannabinus]